ncbi:GNAT family N-acetyltransferase [Pseudomonas sp. NPDC007930]|uniref:GNAT family N-acetyltransferase n=1 Tax=Pseudomonas sp. NPDC007930 TaxID=3364417 RepID=UPI0036F11BB4
MSTPMQTLEDAAFAAWPAHYEADINGWRLRLDSGYTQRANSLNSTEHSQPLSDADLAAIEQQFAARGLRPVVRVTSTVQVAGLARVLASRGYRYGGASQVLWRPLPAPAAGNPQRIRLLSGPAPWASTFARLSGQPSEEARAHQAIVQRIAHPAAWAVLGEGQGAQCCGLGVVVGAQLGLFDIVTGAAFVRRGLAGQLCRELLAWGWGQGARGAFLQVNEGNAAAFALYEKLGFARAYGYGYWVRG